MRGFGQMNYDNDDELIVIIIEVIPVLGFSSMFSIMFPSSSFLLTLNNNFITSTPFDWMM